MLPCCPVAQRKGQLRFALRSTSAAEPAASLRGPWERPRHDLRDTSLCCFRALWATSRTNKKPSAIAKAFHETIWLALACFKLTIRRICLLKKAKTLVIFGHICSICFLICFPLFTPFYTKHITHVIIHDSDNSFPDFAIAFCGVFFICDCHSGLGKTVNGQVVSTSIDTKRSGRCRETGHRS